jgi:PPOX class probable F420-dependent enzyme
MGLAEEKYMSLTTYRKVGTPVASPVWLVDLGDDKIGFYTSSGSGKAKRLAHTPKVIVQASDSRGRVKEGSEPIEATAELVTGDQLAEITTKIQAKYGLFTKVTKLLGTIGGIIKRNRIPYGDRGVVITLPDGVA